MEKEPIKELRSEESITEATEKEKISVEKRGSIYEDYLSFWKSYQETVIGGVVRIHGKRAENGELVDDPDAFVDARPHKITEYYANMNVYEGRQLIACFRLNPENIAQFRIEFIQK